MFLIDKLFNPGPRHNRPPCDYGGGEAVVLMEDTSDDSSAYLCEKCYAAVRIGGLPKHIKITAL